MTLNVSLHDIKKAVSQSVGKDFTDADPFDCVTLISGTGQLKLFLPFGTGRAVADAINAAVAPAVEVAA